VSLQPLVREPVHLRSTTKKSGPLPVKAPHAQKLVQEERAAHRELGFIGLHVTPPGKTDNLIIAYDELTKIGKVSTSRDMEVVQTKGTKVEFNKKHNYYEIDQWFGDADGNALGLIVFHISAAGTKDEADAVKHATLIRDELQSKIPSRARLFDEQ
jgi:hypothetical protein